MRYFAWVRIWKASAAPFLAVAKVARQKAQVEGLNHYKVWFMLNFENLDKFHFAGYGKYDIPIIYPETAYPPGDFIPMNYAKTDKNPAWKAIHCFVDDYQFIRFWNQPDKYISMIRRFKAICSPDFSTYTDMPLAMQIYNHYRKHWLAAYWQLHGITVYPTISWSTPESYEWCFDGEPQGGVIAVSSVGTQVDKESKRLFLAGYEEMMKRINPAWVIFYGKVPEECDWNVIRILPHQDKIKERRKRKWAEEAEEAEAVEAEAAQGEPCQN